MCSAYGELVAILRTLYQKCRLVHADLSEYNILVHKVGAEAQAARMVACADLHDCACPNTACVGTRGRSHTRAHPVWHTQIHSTHAHAHTHAQKYTHTHTHTHTCTHTHTHDTHNAPTPPQGELVIIDVSQAVDLDHPKALDFLREDARHINDFFRRAGVAVLTTRELFDYVVDASVTADNEEAALAALQQLAARWAAPAGRGVGGSRGGGGRRGLVGRRVPVDW